jgi:hypothetical protein
LYFTLTLDQQETVLHISTLPAKNVDITGMRYKFLIFATLGFTNQNFCDTLKKRQTKANSKQPEACVFLL